MPKSADARVRRIRRRSLLQWATSPLSILKGTCVVVVAIGLGSLTAGGTYALWNANATLPGATIVAGTAALAVPATVVFPVAPLSPGGSTLVSFTVVNSGNVPLGLRLEALVGPTPSMFSKSLTIGAGIVTSSAQCVAGTFVPTWTGTFAFAAPGSIGATPLGSAGSSLICLSVSLDPASPIEAQGTASSFGLTIGGVQP